MDVQGVYPYSHEYAKDSGDLELCKASQKQNIACKKAIESTIRGNFDGYHLNADAAKAVISEYGFDRVNFVLANTVQQKDYDGRFSDENKAWAKELFILPDKLGTNVDRRQDFVVESHPAVLDGFINQARKAYKELNLWDSSHCNDKTHMDLVGKVMVLDPTTLKDSYKSGDNQLFYATGGFGCSSTASGRKVYGEFLVDGEETQYQRSDFIGELKLEHLPEWAKQKLAEKVQPEKKPSIIEQLGQSAPAAKPPTKKPHDKGAR